MRPHTEIICTEYNVGEEIWLKLTLKEKGKPDENQHYGPFKTEKETEVKAQEIMNEIYNTGKEMKTAILRVE